jgi:hypothetical protein
MIDNFNDANRKYKVNHPWVAHYHNALARCRNKNHRKYKYYGGKGILLLMTADDFKTLWLRDKAYTLKRPSIDRVDSDKNYEISNCRFIELEKNTWNKKNVIQKTLNGKIVHIFDSAKEAERKTGVELTYISRCALGVNKSARGFQWEYATAIANHLEAKP